MFTSGIDPRSEIEILGGRAGVSAEHLYDWHVKNNTFGLCRHYGNPVRVFTSKDCHYNGCPSDTIRQVIDARTFEIGLHDAELEVK